MDNVTYLESVLANQTFAQDDPELQALRDKRDEIETFLLSAFPICSPTIKYGGSHAKHTMIKSNYDLDVVCYFGADEKDAGNNLEEIYENVRKALAKQYVVDAKTSALRIEESQGKQHIYTHVDVVPGRFIDDSKTDVFLFQNGAEECRLKTNTKTHVEFIRGSGVTPAIRLLKMWREVSGKIPFKTFVLELSVIEILKKTKNSPLDQQLTTFWEALRDDFDNLHVEDPANPYGNDLMPYLKDNKVYLTTAADSVLRTISQSGWQAVFGELPTETARRQGIDAIPVKRPQGTKPWGV